LSDGTEAELEAPAEKLIVVVVGEKNLVSYFFPQGDAYSELKRVFFLSVPGD